MKCNCCHGYMNILYKSYTCVVYVCEVHCILEGGKLGDGNVMISKISRAFMPIKRPLT